MAQLEEEATRQTDAIYLFEQAALQYVEEIAEKSSADTIAMHLDQLMPFIGNLPLAHVHDGTIAPFIKHERARGLAPKSINNALGCVATILNRAARVWRDQEGRPWLAQAPARISRLPVKGKQARSYPLSWAEQNRLIKDMPRHLADPVLYGINTGCREQEICQLRWDWEVEIPELETSVFILPEEITKTSTERVVVLNAVAKRVIESRRGIHEDFVFTYRGHPMRKLNGTAWKRAWRKAGLPTEKGIRKGVHNLRHTCGRRLRSAGVPLETRKALLGHADGDITTHYSAAELDELRQAAEKIVDARVAQTPTLMIVRRTGTGVGKVWAKAKGASAKLRLTP
ncbi:MAG TPA: tyrosine-type recombinase/integrase [Woeseiaceae bacterium]|nr:tyrosine-type recombinase/integrase [Woeseiaceae bacterium]